MWNLLHSKNSPSPSQAPGKCKSSGFTLIELLVVIAIISLLASILLPSLNRAKELTKRTVCASNLHNVTIAYGLYASEYRGCLPVGYIPHSKQYNYGLWGGGDYWPFGHLYLADLMSEPKVFYCPEDSWFNQDWNPWPPGSPTTTRAGYGSRPEAEWERSSSPPMPARFPRLVNLAGKAIVADVLSARCHLEQKHQEGVNVNYTDGSSRWIKADRFNDILDSIDASGAFSSAFNDEIDELWEVFDER